MEINVVLHTKGKNRHVIQTVAELFLVFFWYNVKFIRIYVNNIRNWIKHASAWKHFPRLHLLPDCRAVRKWELNCTLPMHKSVHVR